MADVTAHVLKITRASVETNLGNALIRVVQLDVSFNTSDYYSIEPQDLSSVLLTPASVLVFGDDVTKRPDSFEINGEYDGVSRQYYTGYPSSESASRITYAVYGYSPTGSTIIADGSAITQDSGKIQFTLPILYKDLNGEYIVSGLIFESGVVMSYPTSTYFGMGFSTYVPDGLWGIGRYRENRSLMGKILLNFSKPYDYDPYDAGGESEEDLGGNGTFDGSSDQIDDSTLPTISAANTGFTRIYNPTLAQVQALANYLWTDQTIVQTLWNHVKQFLENPMDAFIAFNLVPCAVPDGGTTEFKVMYIGTGVSMTAAASQFVDVDCGTLDIDEYYGSALDYAPNTKISVFLPFIGTVQLDTDDVMGKTIGIKYRIDIVSGGCVAKITVDGSIHYQYSGHCAVNIPFTSADYTGYISAMLQAAKVGSTIASAGASAAAATAEEGVAIPEMAAAGATAAEMMEASKAYDRRIVGSGVEGATQAAFNSLAPKNISNTVGVVMSSKPVVERSGSFSGNTGYLGIRRPFCIIERPRMCNPSEYGKYNGRPAMITMSLGSCSGFTKVQQVQLTGIPATNPELDEIGAFLKGGVIL